jgi:glutathione S-transferase
MTKPLLVIGNKNYSSWSMRAWLALKHLGVDFDEVQISLYADGHKEKILGYSPSGKVPVYIDGDITIWDSISILEYLAERHPSLWPADPRARALARSVSAEMHSGFTAIRGSIFFNARARGRWVELKADAVEEVERVLEIWETCRSAYGKGGPWLFGEFTAADAMYAPVALRFNTYGIEPGGRPKAYVETVLSDVYVREWISAAEAEVEVIEEFEAGLV